MPLAEINAFHMYYEVLGEGPAVLSIHGGMGGVRSLVRPQWGADAAIAGYRFIFYDRRGVGRSEAPTVGYDLPTFASDALGLLDYLGIERAIVLGTSAGGPIAMQLAVEAPERVRALILANTSARIWREEAESAQLIRGLLEVLDADGPKAAFERRPAYARHSLEPIWRWPEAEAHGWLDLSRREEDELARRAASFPREVQMGRHVAELLTCRAYMGVDLTPKLHAVECPVLLIHGETDTVVPFEGSQQLLCELPQAQLVAVSGAGHMILERPEARQAVMAFLQRVATEQS